MDFEGIMLTVRKELVGYFTNWEVKDDNLKLILNFSLMFPDEEADVLARLILQKDYKSSELRGIRRALWYLANRATDAEVKIAGKEVLKFEDTVGSYRLFFKTVLGELMRQYTRSELIAKARKNEVRKERLPNWTITFVPREEVGNPLKTIPPRLEPIMKRLMLQDTEHPSYMFLSVKFPAESKNNRLVELIYLNHWFWYVILNVDAVTDPVLFDLDRGLYVLENGAERSPLYFSHEFENETLLDKAINDRDAVTEYFFRLLGKSPPEIRPLTTIHFPNAPQGHNLRIPGDVILSFGDSGLTNAIHSKDQELINAGWWKLLGKEFGDMLASGELQSSLGLATPGKREP